MFILAGFIHPTQSRSTRKIRVREDHKLSDTAETATARWPGDDASWNTPPTDHVALPDYLERHYAWAYLDRRNARLFDTRGFLEMLLFGHYRRLGDAALHALDTPTGKRLLQVGCAYGDLTPRLAALPTVTRLDVADAAPLQLELLARKLPADDPVALHRQDATRLHFAPDCFDGVLLFFLLHELPAEARRDALAEALRVCRPGGRVVVVDYQRPHPLHPLRWLMPVVFRLLEPFALAFWSTPVSDLLPAGGRARITSTRSLFGGLYRLVTLAP
jgi:ubiquinone/menaquinone biosynthesis C-methylase UbiE